MTSLVERLRERSESYRMSGPSAEHTARMLDEAAYQIERLTRELADLQAKAAKWDKKDGIDGAACSMIREKLDEFGAPRAAFIDDHVANGILHARRQAFIEAAEMFERVAALESGLWAPVNIAAALRTKAEAE